MTRPSLLSVALAALACAAMPVATPARAQQQSESYKFLNAVREAKGNDVIAMLDRPGSSIVNARDISTGEGALHIVIKRGDETYLRYLLQKGADPNLRDAQGNTPLILAVQTGQRDMIPVLTAAKANPNLGNQSGVTPLILAVQGRSIDMVRLLLAAKANPNLGNQSGVTPLILAVQGRSIDMVRLLLAAKADPDQADMMAGLSARDYANQDTRSTAIAKLFAETPKKARPAVAGPKF